jgi:hypothetical protein
MRFMVIHKVDANMESGGPPSQDIIKGMGALVQESLRSGVFTTGAGLHRSARRARLGCKSGECSEQRGPYQGKNELLASFAMVKAGSLEEAIERARQIAAVLGDVEIEVGPVVEPWDLGLTEKPKTTSASRFLLLCKGDEQYENGKEPTPERRAALDKLLEALTKQGVLLVSGRLAPSAKAARLASGDKGKRAWVDGPFTESKELIAGFSVLQVPSRADALAWADRYAAILGDNEVDVMELEG